MGSVAPQYDQNLPILPAIYPRWNVESLQDPRALQEHQLSWYMVQLESEACEHNTTRTRLQRYISQALAHERALCAEKDTNRYLNSVIADLRTQLDAEKMKLAKAEEELRAIFGVANASTAEPDWNRSPEYEPGESVALNDKDPADLALSDEELEEVERQRRVSNPKIKNVKRLTISPNRLSKH